MNNKGYKIFETMHEKVTYFLVFDPNNEVVYKTHSREDASNFIQSPFRSKEGH